MFINQKSKTDNASIYLVFDNAGSQVESKGYLGISHLLEHLKFNGKNGSVNEMMDSFDENGIITNASTGSTCVMYYLEGLDEELNPFIYDFCNRIVNAEITEEDFEKEKSIVLSEYQMSFGDREMQFILNNDRYWFNNYNPIGCDDDIINITYEDFCDFHNKTQRQPTKVIYTSKNFELDESKFEFECTTPEEGYKDIQLITELQENEDFEVELFQDYSETDNCTMLIMNKTIIEEDFPKISFVNNLLAGGLNSPLFALREVYGMAYNLGMDLVPLNSLQGVNQFFIDTDYQNVERVEELFFETMEKAKDYITEEMLERRRKKSIIFEKKVAIDLYSVPTHNMYPTWDSKDFLETITVEEVHNLIDKYYLDCEWVIVTDKDLY